MWLLVVLAMVSVPDHHGDAVYFRQRWVVEHVYRSEQACEDGRFFRNHDDEDDYSMCVRY